MNPAEHPYVTVAQTAGHWSFFGWQGWGLTCPRQCNPVLLSGTGQSGTAILADLDAPRLELTWQAWPRRKKPDLPRTLTELRSALSGPVTSHKPPPARQQSLHFSPLLYASGPTAALVASSELTRRAIVLRLNLSGLPEPLEQARSIVASLYDYPDDQPSAWSAYDLAFWLPPGFVLSSRSALAGSTRLTFRGPGGSLSFWKLSAAAHLQQGADVAAWFARAQYSQWRWYRRSDQPRHVGPHQATLTIGRLGWRGWPRLSRHRQLAALGWHCPATDRLFQVQLTAWQVRLELLDRAAAGLVCHLPG